MTRLTNNFTLAELLRSDTATARGIDNMPGSVERANLDRLAAVLQEVRDMLGHPMLVSSGYRSPALNRAVGGSPTSDHVRGLAADFTCPGFGSVRDVCEAIAASSIAFDQLIYEQGARSEWVHLGVGPRMRRQVLSWSPTWRYQAGIQRLVA